MPLLYNERKKKKYIVSYFKLKAVDQVAELLTSLDVVNQSFKKSIRGYDAAEVDEFLDRIAETLQVYMQRNKDLERELLAKQESLAEYEKMKDVLHEALLTAQKSADEKVKSARDQAAKIVSEAEARADEICREAVQEADKLREGILQIRNIRALYEQEFRGLLAKYEKMLGQCVSDSPLAAAVESVLDGVEDDDAACKTQASRSPASKKDLEAAYQMLGVDPKTVMYGQDSTDNM